MNTININIEKSNFNFLENGNYQIKLLNYLNSGSYGIVFFTDFKNLSIKILFDTEDKLPYIDYNEIDVYDKLIKNNLTINNSNIAVGKTLHLDNISSFNKEFFIHFNKKDTKIKSYIKNKRFLLFENCDCILMPTFVSFYDYLEILSSNFYTNEIFLITLIKYLIKGVDELFDIGMINLDLKINNLMIDDKNKLKIIDFGLVKNNKNIQEEFNNLDKYYIWPEPKMKLENVMSFMISMIILEILFGIKIYNFNNNKKKFIDLFLDFDFSTEFKHLIRNSLDLGIDYHSFKKIFNKILFHYDGMNLELPNFYHYILDKRGVDIYLSIQKNKIL